MTTTSFDNGNPISDIDRLFGLMLGPFFRNVGIIGSSIIFFIIPFILYFIITQLTNVATVLTLWIIYLLFRQFFIYDHNERQTTTSSRISSIGFNTLRGWCMIVFWSELSKFIYMFPSNMFTMTMINVFGYRRIQSDYQVPEEWCAGPTIDFMKLPCSIMPNSTNFTYYHLALSLLLFSLAFYFTFENMKGRRRQLGKVDSIWCLHLMWSFMILLRYHYLLDFTRPVASFINLIALFSLTLCLVISKWFTVKSFIPNFIYIIILGFPAFAISLLNIYQVLNSI